MEFNYFNIMIIVLGGMTITEFLFESYPKAQKQIFLIAFLFTFIWVGIKFYIGPDILTYVPLYNDIPTPLNLLKNGYDTKFEIGFITFCSIIKYIGINYWGMTLIISSLYFIPIYFIFNKIPYHKTLALLALAIFEYNIMLYELRQCLAVSFIMISYLAYRNKSFVTTITLSFIAITMHKSVFTLYLLAVVAGILFKIGTKKSSYILLGITMLGITLIPLNPILIGLIQHIHLPSHIEISIIHHLSQHDIIQIVLPIYLLGLGILAYYYDYKKKFDNQNIIIWFCIALIVILFQQWMLLNRLRSLFMPILIAYFITTCETSKTTDKLPKQLYTIIFLIYATTLTIGSTKNMQEKVSNTNRITTIFHTIVHDKNAIIDRQMSEARKFWTYDYGD